MNPNPEAAMAAPNGIREDIGAVMTPQFPRGQNPVFTPVDELGYTLTPIGETTTFVRQYKDGFQELAAPANVGKTNIEHSQQVAAVAEQIKADNAQLPAAVLAAHAESPMAAAVPQAKAMPVQFNQVLLVANRLKAKGVKPGTRPFRQLLDKELKKLGLPVHNRKGLQLKKLA